MNEAFSAWPSVTTALALLVGGAFLALLIKLLWGMSQWGRKSSYRVGDLMGGARLEVAEWSGDKGLVHVDGELWRAVSNEPLTAGDKVAVTKVDGLTLTVKRSA